MPEIQLRVHERPFEEHKDIIAYGNKFLSDEPAGFNPSGEWSTRGIQSQEPSKYVFMVTAAKETFGALINCYDYIEQDEAPKQADFIDKKEDEVQELIFKIKTSPSNPCRESGNRLLELLNDSKEDDPSSLGIAMASIQNFYNFLQSQTKLKCPMISLTPEQNIYASWKGEHNRVVSLHFLQNGEVRFVIFRPNDRHPERQIRVSGTATGDILPEIAISNGVWDWISE